MEEMKFYYIANRNTPETIYSGNKRNSFYASIRSAKAQLTAVKRDLSNRAKMYSDPKYEQESQDMVIMVVAGIPEELK